MEQVKVFYYKLVVFVRSLPDPLEISFYGMLGAFITLFIDKLSILPVDEYGGILIAFITNVLTFTRFKIDEKIGIENAKENL